MKRKMFFGIAACMIVVTSIVGLNANKTVSSEITLDGLVMTSAVNAECVKPQSYEGGWCDRARNQCYWSLTKRQCDPRR